MKNFGDRFVDAVMKKGTVLVAGLDPQLRYMPQYLVRAAVCMYGNSFEALRWLFTTFNRDVIEAVAPYVAAVKPQMAFYEQYGSWGMQVFEETVACARMKGLLVITDAKRGDGGDTADAYADGHIGRVPFFGDDPEKPEVLISSKKTPIGVDSVTVHGYIGDDCVHRFVMRTKERGTGIFVVTKTSFKPNSRIEQIVTKSGLKLWQEVALAVDEWGEGTEGESGWRSVGAVLGATYPKDAPWMRRALPQSILLVPGYGGQGASADDAVAGANEDGLGIAVSSSRGITYAYRDGMFKCDPERFADAARSAATYARDELNAALKKAGKKTYL